VLVRVARGDERAMSELYDRTCGRMYGWALRITGDPAIAEEAVLEAYAQAWEGALRHDPSRASVEGWLLMMVRNRALDLRRAAGRRTVRHCDLDVEHDKADPGADPEAAATNREDAHRIRLALSTLSADQRRVIEAAFFDGLSHSEVAEALELPVGTVKTRIRSGLASLRRQLGGSKIGAMA
jgi:RNA polymerase sigma-70 factor (ECF subfamily)